MDRQPIPDISSAHGASRWSFRSLCANSMFVGSIIALAYFVFVTVYFPYRRVFAFDSDEGISLMQAMLLNRGYPFYTHTWLDQPPLFKMLLSVWLSLTDWTVASGRLFVLLHASALLMAMYMLVRTQFSRSAGFMAVILLASSRLFVVLSASVMQSSITMLYLVLAFLGLARFQLTRRVGWAVFCGLTLGISLCCKPMALPLLPVFCIGLLTASRFSHASAASRTGRYSPALWAAGACMAVVSLVIVVAVPLGSLGDIMGAVFVSKLRSDRPVVFPDKGVLETMLTQDWSIMLASALGIWFIVRQKAWSGLVPIAWFVIALLAVCVHKPLWDHHYQFLAIPMCWLGGIATDQLVTTVGRGRRAVNARRRVRAYLPALCVAVVMTIAVVRVPARLAREWEWLEMEDAATPRDTYVTRLVHSYAGRADWMVTDSQMYAFRAGLLVPPQLACTSWKRSKYAPVTEAEYIEILDEFRPELLLDSGRDRLPLTSAVTDRIANNDTLVYEDVYGLTLYVDKSIVANVDTALPLLEQTAAIDSGNFHAHFNLALRYLDAGRYADALNRLDYCAAIELPHYESAARRDILVAWALLEMDRPEHAKPLLSRALRDEPTVPTLMSIVGLLQQAGLEREISSLFTGLDRRDPATSQCDRMTEPARVAGPRGEIDTSIRRAMESAATACTTEQAITGLEIAAKHALADGQRATARWLRLWAVQIAMEAADAERHAGHHEKAEALVSRARRVASGVGNED